MLRTQTDFSKTSFLTFQPLQSIAEKGDWETGITGQGGKCREGAACKTDHRERASEIGQGEEHSSREKVHLNP